MHQNVYVDLEQREHGADWRTLVAPDMVHTDL